MFDGVALPRPAAGSALVGLQWDPADPINRGRRLFLPLNERGTYAEASHNTYVWGLSPFIRQGQVTNSAPKLITSRGFAYSNYNHPVQGTGANQFVSVASASGLDSKNKSLSLAISVYQTSGTNRGTYFGVGGSGTGFWICTGASDADTSGTNLLVLFQAVRWINTGQAVGTGWHDIVLTLDQNGYPSIYYDGKLVYSDTGSLGVAPGSSAVTRVGADHTPTRYTNGSAFQAASVWDRTLTAAEVRRLARERGFSGIIAPANRLFFAARANTSGISGTLTKTLGNATLSAAGTVDIAATLAKTLASATLASAATLDVTGALSKTLASATLSAAGTVSLSATLSSTLASATLVSVGTVAISAAVSQTLASASLSAAGTVAITGTLSKTLANSTLSADGTFGSAITGQASVTLSSATLAAAGTVALSGAVASTLANATVVAAGTLALSATSSVTLRNASLYASGFTGTATRTVVLLWNGVRI